MVEEKHLMEKLYGVLQEMLQLLVLTIPHHLILIIKR